MSQLTNISIVIVTYKRGHTLLDTLESILSQDASVDDVIVVDQTPYHEEVVNKKLTTLHQEKKINWLRESKPSIP